jgi:hypothetical protein
MMGECCLRQNGVRSVIGSRSKLTHFPQAPLGSKFQHRCLSCSYHHCNCMIQAGTCVMPLSRNSLLRAIRQKVPPLLASASPFFIPPTMYYDSQVRLWVVLLEPRLCVVLKLLSCTEMGCADGLLCIMNVYCA